MIFNTVAASSGGGGSSQGWTDVSREFLAANASELDTVLALENGSLVYVTGNAASDYVNIPSTLVPSSLAIGLMYNGSSPVGYSATQPSDTAIYLYDSTDSSSSGYFTILYPIA